MDIALIGYGKMGKAIERICLQRGHNVVLRISSSNREELDGETLRRADVAIEFTNPEAAYGNVLACIRAGVPVICGSTGWNERLPEVEQACIAAGGAMLQASNFSIGVNLFFELNARLAAMMNAYPEYEVSMEEIHHVHKKDAPSGTAITIAERILEQLDRKKGWSITAPSAENMLINVVRTDDVPGTHEVTYSSPIDDITLIHTAHNRDGFAVGAVLSAEFIQGRKGIFTMRDVLGMQVS
jgi:4-hydroxy-tetrahydrodipicolinate reductase